MVLVGKVANATRWYVSLSIVIVNALFMVLHDRAFYVSHAKTTKPKNLRNTLISQADLRFRNSHTMSTREALEPNAKNCCTPERRSGKVGYLD